MSSRFGSLLHNLVGQVREEFTDPSGEKADDTAASGQPTPAPGVEKRAPSWRLATVATLAGPAKSNPIVAPASALIKATRQGKALHKELEASLRPGPRIQVEIYPSLEELRSRQTELAGIKAQVESENELAGFTHAYMEGVFSKHDDPASLMKRWRFIVGAAVTGARSPNDVISNEDLWVKASTPFRVLLLAETIFHELLHVWWQVVKSDPHQDLIIDEKNVGTMNTGHEKDTKFDIDPRSLRLVTEGTIDKKFRQRLDAFVHEAASHPKVATALNKEREKFRNQR